MNHEQADSGETHVMGMKQGYWLIPICNTEVQLKRYLIYYLCGK